MNSCKNWIKDHFLFLELKVDLWKDADLDIPILMAAKREYAKLKQERPSLLLVLVRQSRNDEFRSLSSRNNRSSVFSGMKVNADIPCVHSSS
jgi:hypothetical protein